MARHRNVPAKREMSSRFVIVREVTRQDSAQVSFAEHDHVIQTLAPDRANQSLNVGGLPGRPVRDDDFLDAHVTDAFSEIVAVDGISISDQKARRLAVRERLDNLLACPTGSRVGRHVEMKDTPPVVSKHDKAVQQLKSYGRHDQEVDRRDVADVVLEERSLRLRRRLVMAAHVLRDGRFGHGVTEQLQF